MKTLITLVVPIALLAGSSAFAQQNTNHDYSRGGNYKAPVKDKATAERSQRHESASDRSASETYYNGTSHDYSRTGDYRPKVVQQSGGHEKPSVNNSFHDERPKGIATAIFPNRFGTTHP